MDDEKIKAAFPKHFIEFALVLLSVFLLGFWYIQLIASQRTNGGVVQAAGYALRSLAVAIRLFGADDAFQISNNPTLSNTTTLHAQLQYSLL